MFLYKVVAFAHKDFGPFQKAVDIWKQNHIGEPLPPIPNVTIKLPKGIALKSISQLNKPADIKYEHSWFSRNISEADKAAYKHTYGFSSNIPLVRKELIDQELSKEYKRFLCYATGNLVERTGELHADHVYSKDDIKQRIFLLIYAMNQDKEFAAEIISNLAINFETDKGSVIVKGFDLIIYKDGRYQPTRLFVMSLRNEKDNILLVKSVDNQDKGTQDPELFFANNKFYHGFLDKYYIDRSSIIFTAIDNITGEEFGLGIAAYNWFHTQHSWMLNFLTANITISDMFNDRIQRIFDAKIGDVSEIEIMALESKLSDVQTFVQEFIPSREGSTDSSSGDEINIRHEARKTRRNFDKLRINALDKEETQ